MARSFRQLTRSIPWVAPSRDLRHLPGCIDWRAPSPLAYFIQWIHKDPSVEILAAGMNHQFYGMLPRPKIRNVHEFINELFLGKPWLVFQDSISHGELVGDLEWEAEEILGRPGTIDDVLQSDVVMIPESTYFGLVGERKDKRNRGRDILDFGFNSFVHTHRIQYMRIHAWYKEQVPKEPVASIEDAPHIFMISPQGGQWSKDNFLVMRDKTQPDKPLLARNGTPLPSNTITSSWLKSSFSEGIVFARPAEAEDAKSDLTSPIGELSTLFIGSPQASGQVSIDVLGKYLERIFPGERVKSARDCARVLAEYMTLQETELIEAVGMPRICTPAENKPTGQYPAVETLLPVVDALSHVKSVPGFAGADSWARRLLCRGVLLIHMRGGHIADPDYRTTMYPLEELLHSMIKAFKGDMAQYLKPMILYGGLSLPRSKVKVVKERAQARQALEELPDDLF